MPLTNQHANSSEAQIVNLKFQSFLTGPQCHTQHRGEEAIHLKAGRLTWKTCSTDDSRSKVTNLQAARGHFSSAAVVTCAMHAVMSNAIKNRSPAILLESTGIWQLGTGRKWQYTERTQSPGIYHYGDLSLFVLPRRAQTSQSTPGSPLQSSVKSDRDY